MKKWFFLPVFLSCFPWLAHSECKIFAYDLFGRLISTRCGSTNPEFSCPGLRAWDGNSCTKIPIVERCQAQGGKWIHAQYYYNQKQNLFLDTCDCPTGKAWNGRNCITIPADKICYSYSSECVAVDKNLLQLKLRSNTPPVCNIFDNCKNKKF